MSYHLYEILLESSQMWVKIQSPCVSVEQAMAYFGVRFGGEDPDPSVPVRPYRTFDIFRPCFRSAPKASLTGMQSGTPFLRVGMSTSSGCSENPTLGVRPWQTVVTATDQRTNSAAAYCSDFGLAADVEQRASKSPNVRYAENLKQWEERAVARERSSGEQPPYRDAVIRMAESILPTEPDPDRLIIVVVTDRKDPRGRGVLITVRRNPSDGLHEVPVTHYLRWENCLEAIEDRMNS